MERWREQLYQENFLAHHGIMGQKWGRKMGPPYPLDGSSHSAKEKKAGWRQSLKDTVKDEYKKHPIRTAAALASNQPEWVLTRAHVNKQRSQYKAYKKDLSKIEDAVKENASNEDIKRLKLAYKKTIKNRYDFDKDYKNRKKADKAYDRDINSTIALRNIQDQIVRKSLGKYGNKKVKGRKKTYNDIGWEYVHWDEIMNKKIK